MCSSNSCRVLSHRRPPPARSGGKLMCCSWCGGAAQCFRISLNPVICNRRSYRVNKSMRQHLSPTLTCHVLLPPPPPQAPDPCHTQHEGHDARMVSWRRETDGTFIFIAPHWLPLFPWKPRAGIDNTALVFIDFPQTRRLSVQVRPHGSQPRLPGGRVWNQEGRRQQ